jgi:hypothetical protein
MAQGVEGPGCVLGRHGPVARLDQLDQAIGGVERELHGVEPRRTYVRLQEHKEGRTV